MSRDAALGRPSPLSNLSAAIDAHGRSLRNLAIAAMLLIFVGALIVGPILLPTQGNDAETVAQMANNVDISDVSDGYGFMSLIYAYTNRPIQFLIMLGLGGAVIGIFVRWLRVPRLIALACFMLLAPIFLYLPFFIKDTFTTPVSIGAVLVLLSRRWPAWARIGCVLLLYAAYAAIFRQYYFLIAGVWLGVMVFLYAPWPWRIAMLIMVPLIMLGVPGHIYDAMQEPRDIANMMRIGFAGAGNRTAFVNLVKPDGLGSFVINYFYAAFRLNLPIIGGGPKEAYLFLNLCLYGWLTWTGLRSGNTRISWPAGLFLAHVLTLTIFEPDLGSYLRHVSTAILLLAPSLVMQDRLFQVRHLLLPAPPKADPRSSSPTSPLPVALRDGAATGAFHR